MRILFLTNHLNGNDGWSRYSIDFIEELKNLGNEVLVLTSRKSNQTKITKINEHPILKEPLKYLANPLKSFLDASKVRKIINQFSPDIMHFMAEPYATILPFLGNIKSKTFITVHGTYSVIPILFNDFLRKKISWRLSKRYYARLDGIVAVSDYTKEHLLKYFPRVKEKIRVITNGVNLEKHKIIDLNKKPKNETKKILFVGAVKPRKGILEAIQACKYYRDNFSDNFIYNIVGEYSPNGSYYQGLLKKIKDYNLENKIFFREKVTDEELENYYLNADLFLMPAINIANHFEGFGLVYLEANAKGVPCIGSKDCGAQEAILDGKTGYVVNPHNFKEIAEKIDFVLNKNAISGQDCIEWAKKNDIKIKVKDLINFYQASKNV